MSIPLNPEQTERVGQIFKDRTPVEYWAHINEVLAERGEQAPVLADGEEVISILEQELIPRINEFVDGGERKNADYYIGAFAVALRVHGMGDAWSNEFTQVAMAYCDHMFDTIQKG